MSAQPQTHPAANLFPLIEGFDFDRLVSDISARGQIEPITLMPDGAILDGRNRWRACEALGKLPITRVYEGSDPLSFVISLNLHRRHLNESQRAMVAAKLATFKHGGDRVSEQGANLHLATNEAGALLNVSERSVKSAKKVRAEGTPELIAAVEKGSIAVSQVRECPTHPPSFRGPSSRGSRPERPPQKRSELRGTRGLPRRHHCPMESTA